MEIPEVLTKANWDKKKGTFSNLTVGSTGIGELIVELKKEFDKVDWEKLEKETALKDVGMDQLKFQTAYNAAKSESAKVAKVAEAAAKIQKKADEYKAKIKHCALVLTAAKDLATKVRATTVLDWDDERLTIDEEQKDYKDHADARALAGQQAAASLTRHQQWLVEMKGHATQVKQASEGVESAPNPRVAGELAKRATAAANEFQKVVEAVKQDDDGYMSLDKEPGKTARADPRTRNALAKINETHKTIWGKFKQDVQAINAILAQIDGLEKGVASDLDDALTTASGATKSEEQLGTELTKIRDDAEKALQDLITIYNRTSQSPKAMAKLLTDIQKSPDPAIVSESKKFSKTRMDVATSEIIKIRAFNGNLIAFAARAVKVGARSTSGALQPLVLEAQQKAAEGAEKTREAEKAIVMSTQIFQAIERLG